MKFQSYLPTDKKIEQTRNFVPFEKIPLKPWKHIQKENRKRIRKMLFLLVDKHLILTSELFKELAIRVDVDKLLGW